jgi:hypothetical protein
MTTKLRHIPGYFSSDDKQNDQDNYSFISPIIHNYNDNRNEAFEPSRSVYSDVHHYITSLTPNKTEEAKQDLRNANINPDYTPNYTTNSSKYYVIKHFIVFKIDIIHLF